ncbi:type II toxin-antitoxin system YafO family toxin [Providencia rettgeri]|nr:type II toxin-antitoxin system YafO family toxin [Providencia rettgeri]EJD6598796.1 type II toxin-antitoxin system YafO family toxin [Providencia rettgeri]
MSSSNNLYCGLVYRSVKFSKKCANEPEAENLYQAFKEHWLMGYSPFIGKDALFARPDEALNLHVRHGHADSKMYEPENSKEKHTAKESCWKKWQSGYGYKIPTSNSWLIYAVNENRDAMVMDYIHNAHDVTKSMQYMDQYIEITYRFLEFTKCNQMSYIEHPFDDKYLIENQKSSD